MERANGSASLAVAGAIIGITLAYAGGNIGDGPGWWVVVFCAALATLALFAAWMLLELASGVSDAVTVDRDPSAGMRLGGFLVACGLILGRSAGDWISVDATVRDFVLRRGRSSCWWSWRRRRGVARPTPEHDPARPVWAHSRAVVQAGAAYQVMRLGSLVSR